ncbi:MAG: 50S ribosomal protein L17 [Kiritimatiellae bacterium]|nr:50S ribosomal protein L17 [Kiritimatiellia bacterium]
MRHRKNNVKFGRSKSHREALLAMLAVGLVKAKSVRTTLEKAKAVRPFVEKLATSARKADINARRKVFASLLQDEAATKEMFDTIVPMIANRAGGYTRIVKLGKRPHDGAEMAVIAWVDTPAPKAAAAAPAPEAK